MRPGNPLSMTGWDGAFHVEAELRRQVLGLAGRAIRQHTIDPQNPPFWIFTRQGLAYEDLASLVPPGSFKRASLAEAGLTAFVAPPSMSDSAWLTLLAQRTADQVGLDRHGQQALLMAFDTAYRGHHGEHPHLSLHHALQKLDEAYVVLASTPMGGTVSPAVLGGCAAALRALRSLASDIPPSPQGHWSRQSADWYPTFVVDVSSLQVTTLGFLLTVIRAHGLDCLWLI